MGAPSPLGEGWGEVLKLKLIGINDTGCLHVRPDGLRRFSAKLTANFRNVPSNKQLLKQIPLIQFIQPLNSVSNLIVRLKPSYNYIWIAAIKL